MCECNARGLSRQSIATNELITRICEQFPGSQSSNYCMCSPPCQPFTPTAMYGIILYVVSGLPKIAALKMRG